MINPEQAEFLKLRRDLEAQEAFKANPEAWKRRYIKYPSNRINEIDPRERD